MKNIKEKDDFTEDLDDFKGFLQQAKDEERQKMIEEIIAILKDTHNSRYDVIRKLKKEVEK
jgi:hypothetical protein